MNKKVYLFDWGNTIMKVFPDEKGPMYTWNSVEKMPNADKMLKKLSKEAECYIATNAKDSNKEDIIKSLIRVNIDKYFKDIFCFKQIGFTKPSIDYYSEVFNRLDTDKKNITMVGDCLESDIKGALEFGIRAVLYDPENKLPNYHGLKILSLPELLQL